MDTIYTTVVNPYSILTDSRAKRQCSKLQGKSLHKNTSIANWFGMNIEGFNTADVPILQLQTSIALIIVLIALNYYFIRNEILWYVLYVLLAVALAFGFYYLFIKQQRVSTGGKTQNSESNQNSKHASASPIASVLGRSTRTHHAPIISAAGGGGGGGACNCPKPSCQMQACGSHYGNNQYPTSMYSQCGGGPTSHLFNKNGSANYGSPQSICSKCFKPPMLTSDAIGKTGTII